MCNHLVDCYTCPKISACPVVAAAFGPETDGQYVTQRKAETDKPCSVHGCHRPRLKRQSVCKRHFAEYMRLYRRRSGNRSARFYAR